MHNFNIITKIIIKKFTQLKINFLNIQIVFNFNNKEFYL